MNIQNLKTEIEGNPKVKAFFDDIQTSNHIELLSGWDMYNTDLVYYIGGQLYPVDMLWNKKVNNLFSFIKTYDDELYERLRIIRLIAICPLSYIKISNNNEEDLYCLKLQLVHHQIPVLCESEDE